MRAQGATERRMGRVGTAESMIEVMHGVRFRRAEGDGGA